MTQDVYICYAQLDRAPAAQIADYLKKFGIRCSVDRSISTGLTSHEMIVAEISDSRIFLVLLTRQSSESELALREFELAHRYGVTILHVRLETFRTRGALDYRISNLHWLDASQPPLEKHLPTIAAAVMQSLGRKPPASLQKQLVQRQSLLARVRAYFSNPRRAGTMYSTAEWAVGTLNATRLASIAERRVPQGLHRPLAAIFLDLPSDLERIASRTGQLLALQDPGRRLDATEETLREVAEIQNRLIDRPGPLAEAVRDIVSNWARALADERAQAEKVVEATRDLENPFVFGKPVHAFQPGLFTGRRDLAFEIESNILGSTETPTLLLYGQRRMGKTSLLNQLPTLLGTNFLSVIVDCQAPEIVESEAALLRYLSRCLTAALNLRMRHGMIDTATRSEVEPISLTDLRQEPYSVFEDWFNAFQARLSSSTRILLCLDEFERLQSIIQAGWGSRFLDALRHWLQHRRGLALMFIGSHTFEYLGPIWTDRFLSARRLKISFLREEDVRQLLTSPTRSFSLKYDVGTLAAIHAATRGQPFLTQVVAFELVHHLNRTHRRTATPLDVEAAIDNALNTSGEYFADLWLTRTDEERRVMREVARGKRYPLSNASVHSLRDYDVFNEDAEFAVPLVRRWVEENPLAV